MTKNSLDFMPHLRFPNELDALDRILYSMCVHAVIRQSLPPRQNNRWQLRSLFSEYFHQGTKLTLKAIGYRPTTALKAKHRVGCHSYSTTYRNDRLTQQKLFFVDSTTKLSNTIQIAEEILVQTIKDETAFEYHPAPFGSCNRFVLDDRCQRNGTNLSSCGVSALESGTYR